MQENLYLIYSLIGYPLLGFGLIEAWLGVLLLRSRKKQTRIVKSAAVLALSSSLFCLSTAIAYILASWQISSLAYELAYRSTWSGWFVTVASLQLAFYIDQPENRFARWAGFVLWPFWIASYILVLTTDIFGTHATSLIPCVAETSPLEMPARILGAATIFVAMTKCAVTLIKARGFKRLQFTFFITGLLLFGIIGLLIASGFQLMGITSFDPALASFGSVPWVVLTFYAITRYRLFDIKTAIMHAVFILSAIAAAATIQLGIYMLLRIVLIRELAMVVSFMVLSLGFVMIPQVSAETKKLLGFISSRHQSYHLLLTETAHAIISMLDLKELMAYLAGSVSRYLEVEQVTLLLPDNAGNLQIYYTLGPQLPAEKLPAVKILGRRLEKAKSAVELIEEKTQLSAHESTLLEKEISALGLQLAVPILYQKRIKGVLTLGEKAGGRAFVKQDFDTLEALAGQAAVAFENARLYQMAIRDRMTGLYHQTYFKDRLAEEISRSRRYNLDLTLIMIDIDYFKQFNDTYGHLAGDKVIRAVAGTIAEHARKSDFAARYGGEEFAVILSGTTLESGRRFAERLRRIIAKRPVDRYRITVSIGVSSWQESDSSPEAFIQKSDQALYLAKQQGRNRVCWR